MARPTYRIEIDPYAVRSYRVAMRRAHVLSLLAVALAACGGRIESDGSGSAPGSAADPATQATALYTAGPNACPSAASLDAITKEVRPERYEETAVVELSVAEECTNLGGQWLLGRDVHRASNKFWLGGHGCRTVPFADDGSARYGVLVYRPTDRIATIPPSVCVSFPGNAPGTSSSSPTYVRAIATFATLPQAEAFARPLR
jgi:hypothetical protein